MKKCPPGVLCIENITFIFIIIVFLIILYFVYVNYSKQNKSPERIIIKEKTNDYYDSSNFFTRLIPNYPYNNLQNDVFLNPYSPPLKDERYLVPQLNYIPPNSIPINVSTNMGAVDTQYRQIGILTAISTKGKVLPLMGRPLFVNRDKWQYYTISDQHNSIKLPISKAGKSCTNEYGCDKIYTGDTVFIDGLNDVYGATIYDNDTIKYLPFI